MNSVAKLSKGRLIQTAVLAVPLLFFIFLRFSPDLDVQVWSLSWYTRLIQFYAASFASLIALIAASFAGTTLSEKATPRSLFVTFAFINISALLLMSSIATPNVIISETNNDAFIWSLRFAFPLGAFFFFLASVPWSEEISTNIIRRRRLLWLIGTIVLSTYAAIAFGYPQPLQKLNGYAPLLPQILAGTAIALLCVAALRTYRSESHELAWVKGRLALVLVLLAEAQLFQAFGTPGRYSWLLYHPVTLVALLIAVSAILSSFESAQDLQFKQYFAAVGSIVIGGLSLAIGELGTRWLTSGVNRTTVITLVFIQGTLSFLVLYAIVLYLNRLITERTLALRREQRLRNELTQLIVHDLKSPLSVITSGINLLSKGNLGPVSTIQNRLLSSLEQSGQQILYMIDDLLDVERLEAGVLTMQYGNLSVSRMLQGVIDKYQIVASAHKQQLTLSYPPGLPSVRADKRLLERVFNNLLTNALKFIPEAGHIDIYVSIEGEYLVVKVADDGPGVPNKDKERIFEKFAQVEGTERRGAGLGLTFCKMVIEEHNGILAVEDSMMGGALFKVQLPIPVQPDMETAVSSDLPDRDWFLETS
jgi:signal transduction histidine kinase